MAEIDNIEETVSLAKELKQIAEETLARIEQEAQEAKEKEDAEKLEAGKTLVVAAMRERAALGMFILKSDDKEILAALNNQLLQTYLVDNGFRLLRDGDRVYGVLWDKA